jgi:N-acetyl-gamma-glutamyl-phosphate reductase common form
VVSAIKLFIYKHIIFLLALTRWIDDFVSRSPVRFFHQRDLNDSWRIYSYGYNLHNEEEYAELKKAAGAAEVMPATIEPDIVEEEEEEIEEHTNGIGGKGAGGAFHSTSASQAMHNVGLVGARGYVGAELIRLVSDHPSMTLKVASSRALVGEKVSTVIRKQKQYGGASSWSSVSAENGGLDEDLRFINLGPDEAASPSYEDIDLWFLALPNGFAAPFVTSLVDDAEMKADQKKRVIVDLSADHRFLCGLPDLSVSDQVENMEDHRWVYGLPEKYRHELSNYSNNTLLVSNPGCYATGAQLGIYPLSDSNKSNEEKRYGIRSGTTPSVFGVSGYSGAGTTPSDKNNPEKLENNLMPYSLTNHIHEREISQFVGRKVNFMPHVGSHFRGISLTISLELDTPCHNADELYRQYHKYYENDSLIRVMKEIPEVAWNAGGHHVVIGGFSVSKCGHHAVVCVTMDNLLKGAATQALANANLGLGLNELEGIHLPFEVEDWEYDCNSTADAHKAFCDGVNQ